ncbi:hypothetical protein AZI85_15210 [Bdellovibrio bacteriovorus]|uniref:Uncharacterized protein n=1 Tax=Bdellovibrio bacteriovorus TaxID=959 RepID=A0A150WU81_BDEBC|nr:hypothetical protein [Bdellovibrio bacteriovorus]KYG70039.1 hypothetical protein AZI85_15210 [Bdellovibrio bacteriovorus]BFD67184.1 hypothetical protein HAGR004_22060 [Bdellovibrio sp. HAGR004]
MEEIRAVIGDQNMQNAFWLVVGSLVLSNAGLIASGVVSHFRKIRKMRRDIDTAWVEIRLLKKALADKEGEEK